MAKTPFKLRSSNTPPFKQMGSSPLKQDYVKDIYHKKFNPTGTKGRPPKVIHQDVINKELTRIGKGGKAKYDQIMAKQRATDATKVAKTTKIQKLKNVGGKVWKGVKGVGKRVAGPVGAAMIGWDIGRVAHRVVRKDMSLGEALQDYYLGPKEKGPIGIESKNWQQKLSKYNDDGTLKNK